MSDMLIPGMPETGGREIGARVKLVREARGQSLRAFGLFVGADHSHIGKIERGERDLSRELALALAAKTGATLDYLYFGRRFGMPAGLLADIDRIAQGDAAA